MRKHRQAPGSDPLPLSQAEPQPKPFTEARSYCRICSGLCGVRVKLDENGRLLDVRGDHDHPLTQGYACSKGLQAPEVHNSPARLLAPLKRQDDGSFAPIPLEQALDEIAQRLSAIIERDGPDAVAGYRGTANYLNAIAMVAMPAWLRALGSRSFFSTMTIDQSAKWVTMERLGRWHAGRHPFETADTCLFFGMNPLVSIQGGLGFPTLNPTKRLKEAKARGLKIIVIDPRRTELARQADIHLQPYPGEDVTLAAGLLHLIFENGWEDRPFLEQHAEGWQDLRNAVAPFDCAYVAARAGVDADQLKAAAELFARQARRGAATSGTGPDMGPHSNLAEHLIECLNVVCGRYQRAGKPIANPGVMGSATELYAEVRGPKRSWEQGPRSRVQDLGMLMGEKLTGSLAEEILMPGEGQIRSLFVVGGNPASALPDQHKTEEALRSLELLVAIEPFMSTTAQLAHYILPPKLQYERPDLPTLAEPMFYNRPFAQYTQAVATPPSDELVDEWYPFWALGQRLGKPLRIKGVTLDDPTPPTSEMLLELLMKHSRVPLEEIRRYPAGACFESDPCFVLPKRAERCERFAVLPDDVRTELASVRSEHYEHGRYHGRDGIYTHLLAVRRLREVTNTALHGMPSVRKRVPYNTAAVHPDDLTALGLSDGDSVMLAGEHGRIPAIVEADGNQRPGVVSMAHGWGRLPSEPADYQKHGASTSQLVSAEQDCEPINWMARMTALRIRFERG